MSEIEVKSTVKVFGGHLIRFSHNSTSTKTVMTCAVYIPNELGRYQENKLAFIMYLSGLTCTDENVCQKSGVFRKLAEQNIAFVAPDTSPRGASVPGEDDSWDFGSGAGFYLDATVEPWSTNYNMYSYITKELPTLLTEQFTVLDLSRVSLTGHSMGGHGALTIALKNQSAYKSVSAFSPICHPAACPWGVKAFTGYLGEDRSQWSAYDATELLQAAEISKYDDILIDVGSADSFLKGGQLMPEAFQEAADKVGQKVTIRLQEGYDHSYFFISSFIEQHVDFHAQRLNA